MTEFDQFAEARKRGGRKDSKLIALGLGALVLALEGYELLFKKGAKTTKFIYKPLVPNITLIAYFMNDKFEP